MMQLKKKKLLKPKSKLQDKKELGAVCEQFGYDITLPIGNTRNPKKNNIYSKETI